MHLGAKQRTGLLLATALGQVIIPEEAELELEPHLESPSLFMGSIGSVEEIECLWRTAISGEDEVISCLCNVGD